MEFEQFNSRSVLSTFVITVNPTIIDAIKLQLY